jgi:uncharacterized protein (TIGR02145 family)
MASLKSKSRPIRICVLTIALNMAFGPISISLERFSSHEAQDQRASSTMYSFKRMADGKEWTTRNLNVDTAASYCYDDAELNCQRYGRFYTWEAARRGCQSLGRRWQLPTNEQWRQMAKYYGGVRDDSNDDGKAAYKALVIGGSSGFGAVFGRSRSADGQYARLNAHGFYWTASESNPASAWLYNFGQAHILNRHNDGEKQRAFSVRCVRD